MSTVYLDPVMTDGTGQDIVTKLDTIAGLMGDGVIDDTSTATNKTWSAEKINTELGTKANANLVPSGASISNKLATASDVNAKISWDDASKSVKKNLLNPNDLKASDTIYGVTLTKQSDGSMAIANTANATNVIQLNIGGTGLIKLSDGNYTYSVGRTMTVKVVGARISGDYNTFAQSDSGTVDFTADSSLYKGYYIQIGVVNGTAYSGYIYPMIRYASVGDDTFVPYIPDNTELMTWTANEVLGAENLFASFVSESKNGMEFTVDSDGVVDVDGQPSANYVNIKSVFTLKKGTYTVSGVPSGFGTNKMVIALYDMNNVQIAVDDGSGAVFTLSADTRLQGYVYVYQAYGDFDHVKVYPMINLGTVARAFVPYAMTNRELTEVVETDLTEYVNTTNFTVGTGGYVKMHKCGKICTVTINNVTPTGTGNNKQLCTKNLAPVSTIYQTIPQGLLQVPGDYIAMNVSTASAIYNSITYIVA